MITAKQLQAICNNDSHREYISKPFSVEAEGRWWNAATDGHALLLVASDDKAFLRDMSPPVEALLATSRRRAFTVDSGALYKWANDCDRASVCVACHGEKVHTCDCYYCEITAGDPCPECEGDGSFPNRLQVDWEDRSFDRVLLARYLEPVAGDTCEVFVGPDALDAFELRSPNWRLLCMPMKRDTDNRSSTGGVPAGLFKEAK